MFDHCLYFNTTSLARRLEREWAEAFALFDLTPQQGFVVRAVLNRPGMLQSELAAELSIARATATRAIDALETKGFLRRNKTQRDGREVSIDPTENAIEIKIVLNEAAAAVTARLKRLLGAGEFIDAVTKMRTIRSVLN